MAKTGKKKRDEDVVSPIQLEELLGARSEKERLGDKLAGIAVKQLDTSMKFKEARMLEIRKSIDLYHNKTKKALKGRFNVPLPIMSGFVDTLMSKVDDPPRIKFGHQDAADMKRGKKVSAKWEQDSGAIENGWAKTDRTVKKVAAFAGVGVYKKYAFNDDDGAFVDVFEGLDHEDFECEPLGGQDLEKHLFLGQRNIFKTEHDLKAGATGQDPVYSKKQVLKLIAALNSNDFKDSEKAYVEKIQRARLLGLDMETHNYVGVKIYRLVEWYMEWEGERYYLLLEPRSGIWVRFERLADMFPRERKGLKPLWPFVAWHTHEDSFTFWSKAPADDIRPIAEAMQIIFNQMLDNREKRNFGQRAFDPEIFTDPAQLEWRPDGLVEATTNGGARSIGEGIFEFKAPDSNEAGTVNLMQFMDAFAGQKTGITASAEGASDEKRVGIYYGNLQATADRLGLYNKNYSEAWARVGVRYYLGLRNHIKSNKLMVRMIGLAGYDWEEMVKGDLEPVREFQITVSGGQAEVQLDEVKKEGMAKSLSSLVAIYPDRFNPDEVIENGLRMGGWDEDAIKRLRDVQNHADAELISEAKQAIEDLLLGKKPKLNRGANTGFINYILDWAMDAENLDEEDFGLITSYAEAHTQIAARNMVRKAMIDAEMAAAASAAAPAEKGKASATATVPPGSASGAVEDMSFMEQPIAGTRGGTAARSADTARKIAP